uniref:Uncharacterized protein n=1 Tax=Chenopodium quinoa TaxID=63459 RepID=A0A803LUX7_CHEQI
MYNSGRDGLQIFDLTVKANKLMQGSDQIEQNRLYYFIAGLDDSLDKDRRDLLNMDPLPTVEEAYATIRLELSRRGIMKSCDKPLSEDSSSIGSGFATKGRTENPQFRKKKGDTKNRGIASLTTGGGNQTQDEKREGQSSALAATTTSGKIIGHGTEEDGLYYVNQMSQHGCAALVHGSVEQQLWTWHRRLGYGVNKKGYRCFDLVTTRLYTTMDYDFVETQYYYHHLRSQGESSVEDLSWLTYPEVDVPDQIEQVDKATGTTDNVVQSNTQSTQPDESTTTLFEDPPSYEVYVPLGYAIFLK